jgi:flagellar hook-associated protein 1 FlgK
VVSLSQEHKPLDSFQRKANEVMSIPSIFASGYSGLIASKAGIATTGHNIANANTEGYSRQRVVTTTADPHGTSLGNNVIGTGTQVQRIERVNDEYIDKQLRNAHKDLNHYEEKEIVLKQLEDVFNEMNGDGLNQLISRFFNEFRKLSEEPENAAVRQSVKEATQAVVSDFHRLRTEIEGLQEHIDARIEGYVRQANSFTQEIKSLNEKIRVFETGGACPNDLLDQRDLVLDKLNALLDITSYKDKVGNYTIDIRGVGPLVSGVEPEILSVKRSIADDNGKPVGAYDVCFSGNVHGVITHDIHGGKIGALLDARDNLVSSILERLDDLAYGLSEEVNQLHVQGFNQKGESGVCYFQPLDTKERASQFLSLSDEVLENINQIATGFEIDAPGDNRIAIAISKLQSSKLLNQGTATFDECYNSIVSDVGVLAAHNKFSCSQQKDISSQLYKLREQTAGVSIDEETTNLLQFQHAFDASARVIQVADEMFKTVLAMKRD